MKIKNCLPAGKAGKLPACNAMRSIAGRKIIRRLIFVFGFVFFLFTFYFSQSIRQVRAFEVNFGNATASVSAKVGAFYLSLQGYIAPYASVVLTVDGTVLRSTVADSNGNFSLSQVLINAGFDHFCLDAVDFRKLGESESCFTVPPANGDINKTDIFLPPTLGVFRTDINVGSNALAFGYGMPGATITVHIDKIVGCTVNADKTGYFECNILISTSGQHSLYADAVLNGKPSETQLKRVLIQGLTLPQQVVKKGQQVTKNVGNFLTNLPGGLFILIALLLIILILILIKKLKPQWLPFIPNIGVPAVRMNHMLDWLFKEHKLHHSWMKGVGF